MMVRKKIGLLGIEGCFGNLVGIEKMREKMKNKLKIIKK